MDGRSRIKVHTHERTQVHSARSFLAVTHPSTNRARRYLTSVTESPSKHWSPPRTSVHRISTIEVTFPRRRPLETECARQSSRNIIACSYTLVFPPYSPYSTQAAHRIRSNIISRSCFLSCFIVAIPIDLGLSRVSSQVLCLPF